MPAKRKARREAKPDKADKRKGGRVRRWSAAEFCDALIATRTVVHACEVIGISRAVAYERRETDDEFRAAWDAAEARVDGDIETTAYQRAIDGVRKPIIRLVAEKREPDGTVVKVWDQVGEEVEYDGALLRLLLETRLAARFNKSVAAAKQGLGLDATDTEEALEEYV